MSVCICKYICIVYIHIHSLLLVKVNALIGKMKSNMRNRSSDILRLNFSSLCGLPIVSTQLKLTLGF